MSASIFLLWLVSITFTSVLHANPILPKSDYLLNCGSSSNAEQGPLTYIPDDMYISTGNETTIATKDNIFPTLQTLRYFPNAGARKYCYSIPVIKGGKYIVKTIFYYGGFDGGDQPPVFDQIIDGTTWSIVNTTEDYANGGSSYYEAIVMAQNKLLSVCLARNKDTSPGSSPFISALEVHHLDDSVYNATNWNQDLLVTVARNSFGESQNGDIISFPDDNYNRYWETYVDENPSVTSNFSVDTSTFWNMPPKKALSSALTTSKGNTLTLNWPPFPLSVGRYYIALYFQDNREPGPLSWRVFDIQINGERFFTNVNVTTSGVTVFGTDWRIKGLTKFSLIPRNYALVGPLINAGEILQILSLGGRTVPRDAAAMEELGKELHNIPEDWSGDPCQPQENSWTGITCSTQDPIRIVSLNLTGLGLSGTLPQRITRLTALKEILLGDNKISGGIPDLSALKSLETLNLQNNQLEGPIPESLAQIPNLRKVFLQNNKLDGSIPESLASKEGLTIQL